MFSLSERMAHRASHYTLVDGKAQSRISKRGTQLRKLPINLPYIHDVMIQTNLFIPGGHCVLQVSITHKETDQTIRNYG